MIEEKANQLLLEKKSLSSMGSIHQMRRIATMGTISTAEVVHGMDMRRLRGWSRENQRYLLAQEYARQEAALAKTRSFLRATVGVVQIQSWWRMSKLRRVFLSFRQARRDVKALIFTRWKQDWKANKMAYSAIVGRPFRAWREEVDEAKRLSVLVSKFFKLSIQRLKLTPQSVMAYFNRKEWGAAISEMDEYKIRRLIVVKLFHGWLSTAHSQRTNNYKASQIIARMVRRTRGPLMMKEAVLVCFHMWHRYIAVKKAFRVNKPDPTFGNPYLPQWARLIKTIVFMRMEKKRAVVAAHRVGLWVWFKRWLIVKNMPDRARIVTKEEMAIEHFASSTCRRILQAWYQLIRTRGRLFRIRNRAFIAWQAWAPRKKKLREMKKTTRRWMDSRLQYRCFQAMLEVCREVMSRRVAALRILRRRARDRKLLVCAYAVLGQDENTIFLECWRRWVAL